jgi:hypothetical protein
MGYTATSGKYCAARQDGAFMSVQGVPNSARRTEAPDKALKQRALAAHVIGKPTGAFIKPYAYFTF